jgi:hypothetical protein
MRECGFVVGYRLKVDHFACVVDQSGDANSQHRTVREPMGWMDGVKQQCRISLTLNHLTAQRRSVISPSPVLLHRVGDHAKPLLGLSMLNTIGMVCLVRYAHDLAGAKEGRFCDLPITCTPTHIASSPYR